MDIHSCGKSAVSNPEPFVHLPHGSNLEVHGFAFLKGVNDLEQVAGLWVAG